MRWVDFDTLFEQFNSLAERLRLRTNRKPSYVEEEGAEEEDSQEEVEPEAGNKDDETLEVLKMEQVFFSAKCLVLLQIRVLVGYRPVLNSRSSLV